MSAGISFGLKTGNKVPVARKSAFSALDGDDQSAAFSGPSSSSHDIKGKGKVKPQAGYSGNAALLKPPTGTGTLSRREKQKQDEARKLDAMVFEYDEVYDDMKEAERAAKAVKDQLGAERKPQYISGLIAAAKQRQIDRVRAEDKMVQRERETEGVELADKDAFVTPAYLAQQEELRKVEAAEQLKGEQGPTAAGMTGFWKDRLDEDAKRHEAAVQAAAAAARRRTAGVSLGLAAVLDDEKEAAVKKPVAVEEAQCDPEPEGVPTVSEEKIAEEIGKRLGRKVNLDDEGRIIDHRQLLTGGLNLDLPGAHRKSGKSGFSLPIAERAKEDREKAAAAAAREAQRRGEDGITQAEKLRMSRERQSAMIQQQLLELEDRKRKAEDEARTEGIKKIARRNEESKIEEMKRKAAERRVARQALVKGAQAAIS